MINLIKNRLAELLAQRQLKITKVAKDTGISRNTITATAQNDGTMIKLETIDILCNYLGVTPAEFFEFIPVLFDLEVMTTLFEVDYHKNGVYEFAGFDSILYKSDIFLDLTYYGKIHNFSLECEAEFIREDTNKIVFNVRFSDKQERKIYNEISSKNESYMFSSKITDSISSLILKDFKIQFLNYDDENLDETDKEVFLEFCQKDFEMSGLLSLPF
ncbi:TPA: helix-turn-helix transcriptional regulator [Streptococcus pyogenes]|uniref:Helix-turn-helix transcriptional regulator n=1 Tax=Streptococcus pyogenes TaxID=1314 RepID=A0A660A238_STRPY|nr:MULTISPECIES: helix-turn-helix transcriptional regulator [Streptococcus]EPZ48478.1 Cro/C1-type HTH DNA-binding domain protein [Streptococcus pyogenes GA40634]QBX10763.1 hypothetical protein JavanS475_0024 [Streptococcus satellite phage Javan475]QBX10923.1 hypothetical protein JavanS504_0003 [Streptococcus satellite phage Javan504]HER4521689.1 helix-turn-helix transcriptional regulator [Streptococcus pyogenes NGAS760]HER4525125.1 helix-turn-helix transcriptional regulator [Streptococcus pyog